MGELTEKKKAGEALRVSEERHRTILESIEDGYYEVDIAGNFTFFNASLVRMVGYSKDELMGMNYCQYTASENTERVYQAFNRVFTTGKPLKGLDWEFTRKDGSKVQLEVSASSVKDSEGQTTGFRGILRDITEKKKAEEALQGSEERYRLLFQNSPDLLAQVDKEGRFLTANRAMAVSLGIPMKEVPGKTFFDLMPAEVAQRRLEFVRKALAKEQKQMFEDTRGGRCFHIMVVPLKIPGQKESIYSIVRDITESKRAKEGLRYLKEYNEKIVASIPSSLLVLDRNLNIKSVNWTYRETRGIKDEDVAGKNIKEVFPHQILKEGGLLQAFEEVLATKEPRILYEVKHVSSGHPEEILNITVRGLRHAEEEATLILVIEDVTERARLQEEIRDSRDFMDTIFRTSVDMVVTTDKRGVITFVNRAVAQIAGYKEEDLTGRYVYDFYDRGRERAKDMMGILTSGQALKNYRMGFPAKQGREIPVSVSGSLLRDSQGRVIGTLGFVRDVSNLVKTEDELREKNEELENFVYIVSHDLKSPIVSIQGFSSMLLNDYREKLGAEGERYLDRIRANASRMEVLISDLLALSRVGRVVGAFKDVSSLDIVNRVCNGLKLRLEETGTEVSISDDLPIIHCDADRICQVFENLIANAVKFTRDAEKPKIEIRHEDKGKFHQFCVKDNGIGIDPEYHQKIFEIFQRLNEIEDAEGTGIGLVIVERIVNNHGGKVWVESEKGMGATFYFTLPGQSGHAE